MLQQFEPYRQELRKNITNEETYPECLKLSFKYLEELNELTNEDTKADKNYVHYVIALFNKKLGNYETAIKHCLISLNYSDSYEDSKYINRLWLLGTCYTEQENYKEASKIYYKCSKLFRDMNEDNQRAMIIFNNAKALKNIKAMKKVMALYEKKNLKTVINTYGDMEYDGIYLEMIKDLLELYICEDRQEAFKLLYSIKNQSIRKELSVKLVA